MLLLMLLSFPISSAVAAYVLATASDVGFLQSRRAIQHLNVHVNPEAPSTAHYDNHLKFLGDYRWHIPSTTERGEVIACHQGALLATDKHEDAVLHTWCRFVTEDNQFNFTEALKNDGVCSRVHAGGSRAERDGCVATREAVSYSLGTWVVAFVLDSQAGLLRSLF
ncbi:hypothetical protein BKA62DRAFT_676415 [Auriculariales sp. MPI-PUGE-AT-0066]|nr:hypothetical protein BKA62DRAFT_676415 [Auriculariales sp. MPI-PUGE-AT-0066]